MKITFPMALALLFIGLRLTNHIDWSWWLVLLPLWGPLAVFVFFMALSGGLTWLARKMESDQERKAREASEAIKNLQKALTRHRT